jgi:holo-[acyl-carrier protein] synthase
MLYTGIDLIEVARIERALERWGRRFLNRVFTPYEQQSCGVDATSFGRVPSLAARWAAKEALAKALGVGVRGLGASDQSKADAPFGLLGLLEIEVVRAANGRPSLQLYGSAAQTADLLAIRELALSLSHTREHAIASVIAQS